MNTSLIPPLSKLFFQIRNFIPLEFWPPEREAICILVNWPPTIISQLKTKQLFANQELPVGGGGGGGPKVIWPPDLPTFGLMSLKLLFLSSYRCGHCMVIFNHPSKFIYHIILLRLMIIRLLILLKKSKIWRDYSNKYIFFFLN